MEIELICLEKVLLCFSSSMIAAATIMISKLIILYRKMIVVVEHSTSKPSVAAFDLAALRVIGRHSQLVVRKI